MNAKMCAYCVMIYTHSCGDMHGKPWWYTMRCIDDIQRYALINGMSRAPSPTEIDIQPSVNSIHCGAMIPYRIRGFHWALRVDLSVGRGLVSRRFMVRTQQCGRSKPRGPQSENWALGFSSPSPTRCILFYDGRPIVVPANYCTIRHRRGKWFFRCFWKKVCLAHADSLKRINSKGPVRKICTQGHVFRNINFFKF